MALMVAVVEAVTANVVAVNVAVELPALTVTVAGTTALVLLLDNATTTPPVGAVPVRVTVPVEEVPPVTLAGFIARAEIPSVGATVRTDVAVTPL
jgi:hypothetical protein